MWSYAINCHNVSQYNIDNQKKKKKLVTAVGFMSLRCLSGMYHKSPKYYRLC